MQMIQSSTFRQLILDVSAGLMLAAAGALPLAAQNAPEQVPPRRSAQLTAGFGTNLPLPRDPRLPWSERWWTRIVDSGVKWVRLGQYENSSEKTSWDWVEQHPGEYTVRPEVDEAIRSLSDNGIAIELQLCYGNSLYQGDPATRPRRSEPAPPGVGDEDHPASSIFNGVKSEDEMRGFLNYARFMVNRYKDRIHYWEFWNEPNIGYWQPKVESHEGRAAKGEEYGRALCRVADAVHEADPKSKVIFGGTSEIDAAFALAALSQCPSKIDVMAYHSYPGYGRNEPPETQDALEGADLFRESVLRMPGVRRDIEFWENEWNTIPSWADSSESVQAKYLPRFFLQALSQGVKPFFWEFVPGTDGNEGDGFGLLHGQTFDQMAFTPREAYRAFEVASALFGQAELDPLSDFILEAPARYSDGQLRKFAFRDRQSGKRIYAVWLALVSGPEDNFVPIDAEVQLPNSGIIHPVIVDVRTGQIAPTSWARGRVDTLRVPLKDSVVAVADSSYFDWPTLPETPGALNAKLIGDNVRLSWNNYQSSAEIEIQRSVNWGPWEKVASLADTVTSYTERSFTADHVTYRVRTSSPQGSSGWSNPAWVSHVK
jgi:hypothetical protein